MLGVLVRCLSLVELSAVNLLLSKLNVPPIRDDERVKVASRLLTEDGTTYYSTAYRCVRNSYTV